MDENGAPDDDLGLETGEVDEDGTGLEAWEHQPGEDPIDYHVFELFCLAGHERKVKAAIEKYHREIGKSSPGTGTHFWRASAEWRWRERADDYWRKERRRAEVLLQGKRDAAYSRYGELADAGLAKLEVALSRLEIGLSRRKLSPVHTGNAMRNIADAASKFLEVHRIGLGDTDEDRKRRGRPPEDAGALPAVEDRLKPPEEAPEGDPR